jgi:hypothetical protein
MEKAKMPTHMTSQISIEKWQKEAISYTPNTHMHDRSLPWIDTSTLMKRGEVKKSLKIPKG